MNIQSIRVVYNALKKIRVEKIICQMLHCVIKTDDIK